MSQPITKYSVLSGISPQHLAELVTAALPTKQPYGNPILDRESGMYSQAMVETGGAFVFDGMELTVEPTGSYTETTTLTVVDGVITAITMS